LNLGILPEIQIKIRLFAGPDSCGCYKLPPNDWNIIEPAEFWREKSHFKMVIEDFAREYPQLSKDTNW